MSPELIPSAWGPEDDDALRSFLRNNADSYEGAGAPIHPALWQFGFYGSLVIIAAGVLALVLPAPSWIEHGGFFLLFGNLAAELTSIITALAVPAIVLGILLLGVNLWLRDRRTSEAWRSAVVLQFAMAGGGATLYVGVAVLFVLNLALWIAIFGTAFALGCAIMLAVMGS